MPMPTPSKFARILLFSVVRLPWPAWASGTRSRMILQASYTGVHGSNCMVFTTLHWRTQILSDRATILAGSTAAAPTYAPEQTQRRRDTWSDRWLDHRLRWKGASGAKSLEELFVKAPVSGMHRGMSRGRPAQVTHVGSALALRTKQMQYAAVDVMDPIAISNEPLKTQPLSLAGFFFFSCTL